MQTNLHPAFEGSEHKNLHTKGPDCICRPYYWTDPETSIMHVKHQPLDPENQSPEKRPTWLPVEGDMDWSQNSLGEGEGLTIDGDQGGITKIL